MTPSRGITGILAGLLIIASTMLMAPPAHAATQSATVGGITYVVDDANPLAGATVTGYDGTTQGSTPAIPDTVTIDFVPYAVTTIGADAFEFSGLQSVTIPDSVTTIGDDAFYVNQLTTVTIPDSVTTIGARAFGNNNLTTATIGNSVTTIGAGAFFFNYILTGVTLPDSLTTIGDSAFYTNSLTSITIPGSVTTIGDYAFSTNLLLTVTIGDSVTTIGNNAFSQNDLTTVTIPDSVTAIGDRAFANNNLTTATIGNSVTTIGEGAFQLNDMSTLTLADSVTTIGNFAFADNQLTAVIIPDSVTTIGQSAFRYNTMTEVAIGSAVTTIGDRAFADNQLAEVTIGSAVTTIGESAFRANIALADVVFLGPAPTTFTVAGPAGSLGDGLGLTVHYPSAYAAPGVPTGYTTPLWQGYTTVANPIATFALGGHGTAIEPVDVGYGSPLTAPTPLTATGWNFTGWYTNASLATPFDFTAPVTTDITLYAGWAAIPTLAATGNALTLPLTLVGILALLGGAIALSRSRRTA